MITAKEITETDDLAALVTEINSARWDAANDMAKYQEKSLRLYLKMQGTVFVVCHEQLNNCKVLVGIASARMEMKPYDEEHWLYIDEVDVCADQRRKGAGRVLMEYLIEFADRNLCEEVWLGTELDNTAAKALYQAMGPDEVSQFVGFTYEVD